MFAVVAIFINVPAVIVAVFIDVPAGILLIYIYCHEKQLWCQPLVLVTAEIMAAIVVMQILCFGSRSVSSLSACSWIQDMCLALPVVPDFSDMLDFSKMTSSNDDTSI